MLRPSSVSRPSLSNALSCGTATKRFPKVISPTARSRSRSTACKPVIEMGSSFQAGAACSRIGASVIALRGDRPLIWSIWERSVSASDTLSMRENGSNFGVSLASFSSSSVLVDGFAFGSAPPVRGGSAPKRGR